MGADIWPDESIIRDYHHVVESSDTSAGVWKQVGLAAYGKADQRRREDSKLNSSREVSPRMLSHRLQEMRFQHATHKPVAWVIHAAGVKSVKKCVLKTRSQRLYAVAPLPEDGPARSPPFDPVVHRLADAINTADYAGCQLQVRPFQYLYF